MNQKNIFKGLFLSLGFLALQSCDSDYTSAGSDIIGGGDFEVESYVVKDIKAYSQQTGPVETTSLPEFSIGSLNDDFFGNVSNSLALNLATESTNFTELNQTAVFDSVYLYIPFYNSVPDKLEDNIYSYTLNSVYGDGDFDLKVYQNTYLISLDNPINGGDIFYYNNDFGLFNDNNTGVVLNDSFIALQNKNVSFNKNAINIYQYDESGTIEVDDSGNAIVKERLNPGFWIDLNKAYFQDFFLSNIDALANADTQSDVFRGLYLKASSNGSKGAIGLLALGQGYLRATYTKDQVNVDAEGNQTTEKVRGEIKFSLAHFGGSTTGSMVATNNTIINLMQSTNDQGYAGMLSASDKQAGDASLYLKGGQGSLGVVEIFKQNDFEELKNLREQNLLINDAFLTVYVDKQVMGNSINPPRLFLYNYDDSQILADFANDASTDKSTYGGEFIEQKEDSKRESFTYRIRVREHIQSLLESDVVRSPKLAIVVSNEFTSTVNELVFKKLKDPISNVPQDINSIPSYSVTTPLGTVLHGTSSAVPVGSKMKLEIFFTELK